MIAFTGKEQMVKPKEVCKGEKQNEFQNKVLELEKQLSDIKENHSQLQEELNRVQMGASVEKARTNIQEQLKLTEENLMLKSVMVNQTKEKEELQKTLEGCQNSTKNILIIYKQQVEDAQRISLQVKEEMGKAENHHQEQIATLKRRVKELEDNIKAYQRKDEGYTATLVRLAAYETWVETNRSAKEGIAEFQNKVSEMTQDTI